MLNCQRYLREFSIEQLSQELGIKVVKHPTLPLMIMNYDQIDSPKTHPVVKECRGSVLHTDTYELVAKSMERFYNWGEVTEDMEKFDFSCFEATEKVDGSLCIIYFFAGNWYANTRGSFADGKVANGFNTTWQEGFCRALGVFTLNDLDNILDRTCTYICEFCSPLNKVVRMYPDYRMYLLTIFKGMEEKSVPEELYYQYMSRKTWRPMFLKPKVFKFTSIEEIKNFLNVNSENDATFEGIVIRDRNGLRYKIKSATYLSLHQLKGNDNIFLAKRLLPFVLTGETAELLTYFPEVKEELERVNEKVQSAYAELIRVWDSTKDIETQKDFALAIKDKTPFTGILFEARKKGLEPKTLWRNASDRILNVLFN